MEVDMEDITQQYVKIVMEIGIHMMIQIVQKPQKKMFALKMLMFYSIEEKIGDKEAKFWNIYFFIFSSSSSVLLFVVVI